MSYAATATTTSSFQTNWDRLYESLLITFLSFKFILGQNSLVLWPSVLLAESALLLYADLFCLVQKWSAIVELRIVKDILAAKRKSQVNWTSAGVRNAREHLLLASPSLNRIHVRLLLFYSIILVLSRFLQKKNTINQKKTIAKRNRKIVVTSIVTLIYTGIVVSLLFWKKWQNPYIIKIKFFSFYCFFQF